MTVEPTPVQKFMSSPYVFEEYELPYDYANCVEIKALTNPASDTETDPNVEIFVAIVEKIYGVSNLVAVDLDSTTNNYEVMAQVVKVDNPKTDPQDTTVSKTNLVLGFISERVAASVGSKFNKKKGVKAENPVQGNAYVFAYCIKSTGTGNDAVSTPYLKAWKVQPKAISGMVIYNGSVSFGEVKDATDTTMLGWYDVNDSTTPTHKFVVTKSSSLLEGMHKDILPGTYMPDGNAFYANEAAYRLKLVKSTVNP